MMLWKNRNKKVGLCVMVVTSCLILAAVWAVLATPETALAVKPDKPGKPGGGGAGTTIYFDVLLGVDENGTPVIDNSDIFMVSGSPIEGRIESIGGGTNIDRMIVNKPSPHIDITSVINVVATQNLPQDVADCFDVLLYEGRYIGGVKGTLLIELPNRTVNEMTVDYNFRAKDTKERDVDYNIRTTGTLTDPDEVSEWIAVQDAVNDGTANPDNIPNFSVQVAGGTTWTLSKSGSQKFACTGDGTFVSGFGIRITRPRLERENSELP